jgi:hypothetical protein
MATAGKFGLRIQNFV